MGCDIHCYIEYRPVHSSTGWSSFGGRINPGRDYEVFGALAGVRTEQPKGGVPPRGVPEDMAWGSAGEYWLWISDSKEEDTEDFLNGDGRVANDADALMIFCLAHPNDETPRRALLDELHDQFGEGAKGQEFSARLGIVSRKTAEEWHARKGDSHCRYLETISSDSGKPRAVQHPDWHSHSWLTREEWETALKLAKTVPASNPKYYAMLAAMQSLESSGNDVRVVFWFDN